MADYIDLINEINPEAIVLTGFDDCIINIVEGFELSPTLLYDTNKIINVLITRDGMTESEAFEYFDFNIIGAYFSEHNPVFTCIY